MYSVPVQSQIVTTRDALAMFYIVSREFSIKLGTRKHLLTYILKYLIYYLRNRISSASFLSQYARANYDKS